MDWYRVVKTIKGHRYIYEQRTWREGKKVRTESRYIGRADDASHFVGPAHSRSEQEPVPPQLIALAQEARKYKTAEEFVEAQLGKNPKVTAWARNWNEQQFALNDIQPVEISEPIHISYYRKAYWVGEIKELANQYAYATDK